ncbi:fibronectin type III domain-containing protein [Cohnella abietis]|uniref:Uncharacterized protein n=1 Tax=Cohnella abietis TaxID=2507935 RepID=A0A3T1CY82_9BACL|nr:fibronectin type III domain-containing protein [Cohnella abietis]BBI30822.1 hypothetical protein KCTCHS21_02210 [Cohnella abietis]
MKKTKWLSYVLTAALGLNLFTAVAPPASAAETTQTELDISKGDIVIDKDSATVNNVAVAYNPNGYVIKGTGSSSATVTIKGGVEQNVTLNSVRIDKTNFQTNAPAIGVTGVGTKANLILSGNNIVSSDNSKTQYAAINVQPGSELVIDTIDGSDTPKLTATSGGSAAAIGGNQNESSGKITINHGSITATFGSQAGSPSGVAAVIGGGAGGVGGTIVINGGIITATQAPSQVSGAVIGQGDVSGTYPAWADKTKPDTLITINGGIVITKNKSNPSSESIGMGNSSANQLEENKTRTKLIVNGGNFYSIAGTNGAPLLLYNRIVVNTEGVPVYATAIKADTTSNIPKDTEVTVKYAGNTIDTVVQGNSGVNLFLPEGTTSFEIFNKATKKSYFGSVETTNKTASTYPYSSGTVSRAIATTAPSVSVLNNGDNGNSRFYYGTSVTLSVNNLEGIVNKSGYPLKFGSDFTVEWFKGPGGTPTRVPGNSDNPTQLTVTALLGEVYRAKLVAIDSAASKLDSTSSTNISANLTADWQKRTLSFTDLQASYPFGAQGTVAATVSAGSGSITYESSNSTVLSVNASTGAWTALKAGSATITASVPENVTSKQSLATVSQQVQVTPIVPRAPVQVSAVPGNKQAEVSFGVLDNLDGSVNTGYTVTAWDNETEAGTGTGTASPITVTGLTNGTAYTFKVLATNAAGNSPASSPSAPVTPAAAPDAPTGVAATAGNGQATVQFVAPSDNGSEITLYTATAWNEGSAVGTGTGRESPITVSGLTNGKSYKFTVVAKSAVGNSPASSASSVVTPATVPDAPTIVTATRGYELAKVTFTEPADNGSPITLYTVTWNNGTETGTKTGTTSPITVTGLTNGKSYTFTVVATNTVGDSEKSSASVPVTPAAVPNAPTGVTATAGDGQAEVSFTAPSGNGSAITLYTLTVWENGAQAGTVTGTKSSITVTGLTNGKSYKFTVVATNAVGDSVESAESAEVTPATVPDAPTKVTAERGHESASVIFTAPSNNGSEITLYTVTWNNGTETGTKTGTKSPITVTGLTNGTAYTFTVVATNAVGNSAESAASAAITPAAVPGAPTGVTAAAAGNGQVTVSFTEQSGNGSEITLYTVTAWNNGTKAATATGLKSSIIVTGLTYGTPYTFSVVAKNEVGDSPESEASEAVTLVAAPGTPTNVTATAGNGQAVVGFTAPSDNGSEITLYTVTAWENGTQARTETGTKSPITVTGLTNGKSYTFTVVATNAIGDSAVSTASNAVTPTDGSVISTPTYPGVGDKGKNDNQTDEIVIPGNQSGTLQLNEEVWVIVPAGTKEQAFKLKVEKLTEVADLVVDKDKQASPIFELTKSFVENFRQNITLKFAFDTSVLKDDKSTVSVFYFDETARRWVDIGGTVSNGFITVEVNHFTKFAVFVVAKNTESTNPQQVETKLTDIEGHWAASVIKQAVSSGFVTGYANGQFKPNDRITRAEFVGILVRALNLQTEGAKLNFTDIDKTGKWALKPIAQAVEAKLITGYNDGSFRPNDEITRAEIVAIIARAFNWKVKEGVVSSGFADDRLIPVWAKGAVEAAREKGIVSGRSGNNFAPNDQATRAEALVILLNALSSK